MSLDSHPSPARAWWASEGLTEAEALDFDRHFLLRRGAGFDGGFGGRPANGNFSSWATTTFARLIWLTVVLLGIQFSWSLEFSYGTPYLLSLGLSKSTMSLVWLAGPVSGERPAYQGAFFKSCTVLLISIPRLTFGLSPVVPVGLIMHPLIGAVSDRCDSRLGRRRPFLLVGGVGVLLSLLSIGWTAELVHSVGGSARSVSLFAVLAFIVLDFSINTMQAVSRALIVDVLPVDLQEAGNAWAGKMLGVGSVVGGYLDLVAIFPFLGDTQLKILCLLCCLLLALTLGTTCVMVREVPLRDKDDARLNPERGAGLLKGGGMFSALTQILQAVRNLPEFVLNLLRVQVFAWVGWFPFMFYSTTWVAEFLPADEGGPSPHDSVGVRTRAGSRAFLIYSLVSAVASFVLPYICRPSSPDVQVLPSWPERAGVFLRILKKPELGSPPASFLRQLPTLPQIFTLSLIMFGLGFWATVLIASCGVPWAVAMWAPYALIGEFVQSQGDVAYHPVPAPTQARESSPSTEPLEAGMVLGIHNISIVIPQLLTSLFASLVFRVVGSEASVGWLFPALGLRPAYLPAPRHRGLQFTNLKTALFPIKNSSPLAFLRWGELAAFKLAIP
ncbi:hypothetical protein L0F63_004251, partial [Massospora cicadina]